MTDDYSARFAVAETTITKVFLSLAPNHASVRDFWLRANIYETRQLRASRNAAGIELVAIWPALMLLSASPSIFSVGVQKDRPHINEALRLSPRDTFAHRWMVYVGLARRSSTPMPKQWSGCVGARRERNYSVTHFDLAALLARLGKLDEARAAVECGACARSTFHHKPLPWCYLMQTATIRRTVPDANASLRACDIAGFRKP